jgi:hypothetical protein
MHCDRDPTEDGNETAEEERTYLLGPKIDAVDKKGRARSTSCGAKTSHKPLYGWHCLELRDARVDRRIG